VTTTSGFLRCAIVSDLRHFAAPGRHSLRSGLFNRRARHWRPFDVGFSL
jgi:hypothetical protein